jgi:large subunit ribosomal protein L10
MSKPVKNLISKSYEKRFEGVSGAVVVDIRGVKSNDNNTLRTSLAQDGIRITVVKNNLARRVFADGDMAAVSELLDGPAALVYGAESVVEVARALIKKAKDIANFEYKGAVMDGQVFGPDQIEALSKYPTRDEAIAQVIQVILSPASNIAGCLVGPAGAIAACLKTIEEKLEKGEQITKVA